MRFIKTAAHRRWVAALFEHGFQAGVESAWKRKAPLARAYRYICGLEEAGVICQWTIDASTDVLEVYYELESDGGAPLFVADAHWDAFEAEARQLGLVEVG